jgi:DNA-binding transcriptional regulator YiaG
MTETTDLLELAGYIHSGRARRIRKTAGLSTESLARDLGVTAATVARWETGAVQPPRVHALAWLRLLRRIDATVKGMTAGE